MKISKREKKLLIVSIFLVSAVALYFLVVTPIHEKHKTVNEEYDLIKGQYDFVQSSVVDDDDMKSLIDAYRNKIRSLETQLPSVVHLEQIIDLMFSQFEANEIIISSITFAMNDRRDEVADDTELGYEKLSGPRSIEEILDEYEESERVDKPLNLNGEEISEMDYNNISYLSINITFTGNYNNLKSVLEDLENLEITAVTTDINISKEAKDDENIDNNSVNVGLSLAIPFFYDNEKEKEYIYEYSFDRGADYIDRGPFEYDEIIPAGNDEDTSNQTSIRNHLDIYPDFYVTLNSEASDLPAQSLSQYTTAKSSIALNSNSNERFELNITESSGQYSYQLKNQLDTFPSSTSVINFAPESDDIIVKVLSSPRGKTDDNSSMTLVLNNVTDKKVIFYVFYDDERPRFNLVVNEGKFEILRN